MANQYDWAFLEAATPDLQRYILSPDLFWPLRLSAPAPSESAITPQLTIGSLLLSHARLSALAETSEQRARLAEFAAAIAKTREEWRANWAMKAAREYSSRLNLWQQYIRELRAEPRQQWGYYTSEVRQRAILALLEGELLDPPPAHETEQLTMLDSILRGLTVDGIFVWEPGAVSAFSRESFWFLYVTIR
jgi:hypothetical protein